MQSDTGSKKIIVTRVNQTGDGQMQVKVVRVNDGSIQISEDGTEQKFQWAASNGDSKSKVMAFVANDEAAHCVMAASIAGIDDESLAQFATDHPAADLDADGKVSPREREAYLTAVASLAPAAVLQKFPHADKNSDSALDLNEAAQLVSGGLFNIRVPQSGQPHMIAFAGKSGGAWQAADGPCKIICEETPVECKVICVTPGDEEENCKEIIVSGAKSNGENVELKIDCDVAVAVEAEGAAADKNVFVMRTNPDDAATGTWTQKIEGQPMKVAVRMNNALAEFTPAAPMDDVATWLTENVIVVPTTAQLRDAMTAVEAAPLVQFKNMHPEADTNNDGSVTVEERDAFIAEEMKNVHKKILEQFPEADANKDGEMTETEMHEFFKARVALAASARCTSANPAN
ncbi:MAG: EF-hand domain-containing protein [Planctomycetes bacterium]|nr:EF-hand domain-containing protein [Planctomycetota bacterium]